MHYHRGESRNEKDSNGFTSEDSKDMQNKKPKVGGGNGPLQQTQERNDNKPWQGWRGKGDFRVLKSNIKQ